MTSESRAILIVDDDKYIRDSLSLIMKARGYEPLSFEQGIDAVKEVLNRDCLAVVLDYHMPGLGGMDTIKAIKKVKPELPIIIVTGDSSEEVKRKVGLLNIHKYFLKPIDLAEFEGVLAELSNGEC